MMSKNRPSSLSVQSPIPGRARKASITEAVDMSGRLPGDDGLLPSPRFVDPSAGLMSPLHILNISPGVFRSQSPLNSRANQSQGQSRGRSMSPVPHAQGLHQKSHLHQPSGLALSSSTTPTQAAAPARADNFAVADGVTSARKNAFGSHNSQCSIPVLPPQEEPEAEALAIQAKYVHYPQPAVAPPKYLHTVLNAEIHRRQLEGKWNYDDSDLLCVLQREFIADFEEDIGLVPSFATQDTSFLQGITALLEANSEILFVYEDDSFSSCKGYITINDCIAFFWKQTDEKDSVDIWSEPLQAIMTSEKRHQWQTLFRTNNMLTLLQILLFVTPYAPLISSNKQTSNQIQTVLGLSRVGVFLKQHSHLFSEIADKSIHQLSDLIEDVMVFDMEDKVGEALAYLARKDCGAIPITKNFRHLAATLTSRDCLIILKLLSSDDSILSLKIEDMFAKINAIVSHRETPTSFAESSRLSDILGGGTSQVGFVVNVQGRVKGAVTISSVLRKLFQNYHVFPPASARK